MYCFGSGAVALDDEEEDAGAAYRQVGRTRLIQVDVIHAKVNRIHTDAVGAALGLRGDFGFAVELAAFELEFSLGTVNVPDRSSFSFSSVCSSGYIRCAFSRNRIACTHTILSLIDTRML